MTGHPLLRSLATGSARVGYVGLGYVGLSLAIEFAKAGYTLTGIDVTKGKVDALDIMQLLHAGGGEVSFSDPWAPVLPAMGHRGNTERPQGKHRKTTGPTERPQGKQRKTTGPTERPQDLMSVPPGRSHIAAADCVRHPGGHTAFDFDLIVHASKLVVDTRNATKVRAPHVLRIGAPGTAAPLEVLSAGADATRGRQTRPAPWASAPSTR